MPDYTVELILPDCCADWEADGNEGEPTPIDAVKAFQNCASGSPDLYVYKVTDNTSGKCWHVDMASGPSVRAI
jgi:hypothetical protein